MTKPIKTEAQDLRLGDMARGEGEAHFRIVGLKINAQENIDAEWRRDGISGTTTYVPTQKIEILRREKLPKPRIAESAGE